MMDTGKIYKDVEGNECTIWQMLKREPEWAANRLQLGEKAIERLKDLGEWPLNKGKCNVCACVEPAPVKMMSGKFICQNCNLRCATAQR
jgi:hypothetical protein